MSDIINRLKTENAWPPHYGPPALQVDAANELSAVRAERDQAHRACEQMGLRMAELRDALGKVIDYCDAATHGDGQYANERSDLLRIWRGEPSGNTG